MKEEILTKYPSLKNVSELKEVFWLNPKWFLMKRLHLK